jgi:hypothetical protein
VTVGLWLIVGVVFGFGVGQVALSDGPRVVVAEQK